MSLAFDAWGNCGQARSVPAAEPPARVAESLQQIELALAQGFPLAEAEPQRPEFQIGDDVLQQHIPWLQTKCLDK